MPCVSKLIISMQSYCPPRSSTNPTPGIEMNYKILSTLVLRMLQHLFHLNLIRSQEYRLSLFGCFWFQSSSSARSHQFLFHAWSFLLQIKYQSACTLIQTVTFSLPHYLTTDILYSYLILKVLSSTIPCLTCIDFQIKAKHLSLRTCSSISTMNYS